MSFGDCRGRFIVSVMLLLAAGRTFGEPKTYISAEVGWSERARAGSWTPIYVTVSDPKSRNAILEFVGPYDSSSSMRISEGVALSPQAQTYVLTVPFIYSFSSEPTLVRVLDAETGKMLAEDPIVDQMGDDPSKHQQLREQHLGPFIGVSGRTRCLTELETATNGPMVGWLPPSRLPRSAEGYAALDVLVLNQPGVTALDIEQQQGIVDWVRGGGASGVVAE